MSKISKFFFKRSIKRNLKESIEISTTNKITLLPTMKLLGYDMPSDDYIKRVYETYWWNLEEKGGIMIREALIKGLTGR